MIAKIVSTKNYSSLMNLGTHDDCLPQLNFIHLLFEMFCDAEIFQKVLG